MPRQTRRCRSRLSLQLCASLRARLCYSPYAEQFEQQRVLKSKASIVVLFLEQVDEALTGALASWRQQDSRYQARQVERLARKIERDGVCQFLIIGSYEQRRDPQFTRQPGDGKRHGFCDGEAWLPALLSRRA